MDIQRNFPEAHVIDMSELVHSMTREHPHPLQDNKTELALIHVVEQHVRGKDKEMYKPKFLSVGPHHYESPAVQDMHRVKYSYLDYILKLNPERKLADYLSSIVGIERQVKCAYANEIRMDRDTFLKLLLLDGCFILVALNGIEGTVIPEQGCNMLDTNTGELDVGSKGTEVDQMNVIIPASAEKFCKEENSNLQYYHHDMIVRDILLLENQIPFCVVEKIFEVLTGRLDATVLLRRNIVQYILNNISYTPRSPMETQEDLRQGEFYHLLHLCHMFFEPSQKDLKRHQHHTKPKFLDHMPHSDAQFLERNEQAILPCVLESKSLTGSQQQPHWHQATQYHAAKIDFKKRELGIGNGHSLLDIGFSSGTMEIPCLSLDPTTYCLLSNLVAFEQTCPQFGNHITSYVQFLSQLVSTPDDAAMLIEKGIIINHLQNDEEVMELFSGLCEGASVDFNSEYYLKPVCRMVEEHYQRQRSKWRQLFGVVSNI